MDYLRQDAGRETRPAATETVALPRSTENVEEPKKLSLFAISED